MKKWWVKTPHIWLDAYIWLEDLSLRSDAYISIWLEDPPISLYWHANWYWYTLCIVKQMEVGFLHQKCHIFGQSATDLTRDNSPRESWCQGHPDAESSKLLLSVFFLFLLFALLRYATATLLTINVRLLWRKFNIFC